MTKRKVDAYEDCLREYVHSFHARRLKEKRAFIKEIHANNSRYANGYAAGLNEAINMLRVVMDENGIPLDSVCFECVGLSEILSALESAHSD